jgi:hypothetical protein
MSDIGPRAGHVRDDVQCQSGTHAPRSGNAQSVSRRGALRRGALAIGGGSLLAAALASPAWAFKVPQSQAGYKNSPNGGNECDRCLQFQPPSACKIVEGAVSPSGSCNFFAPKPK